MRQVFKRTPMTFEVGNDEVTTYREITPIKFHFYLLRICAHNCLITTAINQLYTDYVLLGRSSSKQMGYKLEKSAI